MRLAVWFHSGHFLSRSSFLNSQVAFDCRLFSFLFNKNENGLWPVILSRFHPTPFEFRDHLGGIFHQEDPRRLPAIFAASLKEFLFFTQIIRRFPPFCRIFAGLFAGFFWPGFPVVSLYSRRTFGPFFFAGSLTRIPHRIPLFSRRFDRIFWSGSLVVSPCFGRILDQGFTSFSSTLAGFFRSSWKDFYGI